MTQHFRVALAVVCLTLITIGLGLVPGVPEYTAFAVLVYLVWYHVGYLAGVFPLWAAAPRRLNEAAIDSVYYIGFLVTVMELAASALILFMGSDDPKPILIRFCIGLLATGYAVVARLHLQSSATGQESTIETVWQEYAVKADKLLTELDLAISRVKTFGANVDRELSSSILQTQSTLQDVVLTTTKTFASELKRAADGARAPLDDIHQLLTDSTIIESRRRLQQEVENAATASARLSQSLDGITARGSDLAKSFRLTAETSETLITSAANLRASLERLTVAEESLANVAADVQRSADSVRQATESSELAARSAASVAMALTSSTPAVGTFTDTIGGLTKELADARAAISELATSWSSAAQQSRGLATSLQQLDSQVPPLSQRFGALSIQTGDMAAKLGSAVPILQHDIESSTAAVLRLANTLSSLAELIIERTNARQGVG